MKIVTFVNGKIGVNYLKELVKMEENIVGVVVWPDDSSPGFPQDDYSVREVAFENNLPAYQPIPKKINSPEFIKILTNLKRYKWSYYEKN